MNTSPDHGAVLQEYLQVIRRRKWIIVSAVVLVPLVAIILSVRQTPVYEASAKVLLSRSNLANSLTGVQDSGVVVDDRTLVQTQADFARVPEIANRVLTKLGLRSTSPDQFLDDSSVSTATDSDILTFKVRNTDADLASREATEYARQYTRYRHEHDTASLESARQGVARRIDELVAAGQGGSSLYGGLVAREQELQTMEALQTSNASVIQTAGDAKQVSPTTLKNAVLGLFLGLVLGLGLAFLREALDTRIRSSNEVGSRLDLPLLARIPSPPKGLQDSSRPVMLEDPSGVQAESFRMLRTNLEFAMLDHDVRSILITSAVEQEGKSTTAANLAIAFASAGRRVVLVDLDLRKPRLDRFFELDGQPGIMDVLRGARIEEQAVARVPILPEATHPETKGDQHSVELAGTKSNGAGGNLEVLPTGKIPPNPGEVIGSTALANVLAKIRQHADLVLIDSPPLLQVGDPMTLSTRVDAVVLVARLQLLRRNSVAETHRLLSTMRAKKLGFVLTAGEAEAGHDYGYGYRYRHVESRQQHETEPVA
jgi:polysaccharide biosynthesis transport protein